MISNLSNLLARRDLLSVLIRTELRTSVAGSKLGWVWWFFDPVLMMLVYWGIVAGIFDRGREEYSPYPTFLFAALITWKHFATTVTRALSLLRSQERLIKSIPFPTVVLPLSIVFSGFAYFLFGFVILLAVAWIWPSARHTGDYLPLVQVPLLMTFQLAITAGACMAFACFGTLFRDLSLFTTHLLRVGFYLSPSLYGIDAIQRATSNRLSEPWSEVAYQTYMLNPFAMLISGYRDAVLYGQWAPAQWWLVLLAQAALVLWGGFRIYQHYDRRVIKFL